MEQRGDGGPGIRGPMSELYDVFVDWPGRLSREMPGIERQLEAAGARKVLDVGCGTGRHLQALRERGYDAEGADASPDMLERAAELLGNGRGLHQWRAGEPVPEGLARAAPFDAAISMGNVWPSLSTEREARAAARALRGLVRPGGLVLLGLKALGVRLERNEPYLPLLRRLHGGRPLFFVRFVDAAVPPGDDGVRRCDLHISVLAGEASEETGELEALLHRAGRVRAWMPAELGEWLAGQGFEDAAVSGSLEEQVEPGGEDVFASARVPREA